MARKGGDKRVKNQEGRGYSEGFGDGDHPGPGTERAFLSGHSVPLMGGEWNNFVFRFVPGSVAVCLCGEPGVKLAPLQHGWIYLKQDDEIVHPTHLAGRVAVLVHHGVQVAKDHKQISSVIAMGYFERIHGSHEITA